VAHVEKRDKNRRRARYRGPDGKERSKTFERKIDAERYLTSVEASKLQGAWVDPRAFRTLFGDWATGQQASWHGLSNSTPA
jgi:hypothetical protein